MAIQVVRSSQTPPTHVKTFSIAALNAQSLHSIAGGALQNHLPSAIHLNITTGGTVVFKDATSAGTSNTITYAAGTYTWPWTASTLEASTAVGTITVAWHSEP